MPGVVWRSCNFLDRKARRMAQLQPDQERLELRITGGEIDVCTADAGRPGSRPGRALIAVPCVCLSNDYLGWFAPCDRPQSHAEQHEQDHSEHLTLLTNPPQLRAGLWSTYGLSTEGCTLKE